MVKNEKDVPTAEFFNKIWNDRSNLLRKLELFTHLNLMMYYTLFQIGHNQMVLLVVDWKSTEPGMMVVLKYFMVASSLLECLSGNRDG